MAALLIVVRLIPYIALSGALTYFLIGLPQSREYLALIRETAGGGLTFELGLKYLVIAIYYLLFCFLVGKSLQEIFIDDSDLDRTTRRCILFGGFFTLLFAIPIAVVTKEVVSARSGITIGDVIALAIAALGVAAIVAMAIKMTRLNPRHGQSQSEPYFTGLSIAVCAALIAALFAIHSVDVVRGAQLFGAVGVLVGMLAFIQGAILLLTHWRRQNYPVLSVLATLLILGHLVTYLKGPGVPKAQAAAPSMPVRETKTAFSDWLRARRNDIADFKKRNPDTAYPVFVVAAQGGGYYAAYHAGLFLARLQDRCPSFANHTFAISAVSGGSLGAAVFAEAVRNKAAEAPLPDAACNAGPLTSKPYETTVRKFFNFDFLTPLIASALLFDAPSVALPAIRLGPDRGEALQKSFEAAWRDASGDRAGGLSAPFYGRWKANEAVPALFLNTTSANLGIPNLISELDLRASSRYSQLSVLVEDLNAKKDPDEGIVRALQEQIGFAQLSFVNTLQFNQNPGFPLSFAVTSSARFPYVTPTSLVRAGPDVENALFKRLKYLQLLDGGMVDNSGLLTASEIKYRMDDVLGLPEFADLKGQLKIHLITFSHEAVALYKPGDEDSIAEAVAPLIAFDRIRMSRRSSYQDLTKKFPDGSHEVTLFDGAFNAPLSWSLSNATKGEIEKRAGGIDDGAAKPEEQICCLVKPGSNASPLLQAMTEGENNEGMRIMLAPKAEADWKAISESNHALTNQPFVANATSFTDIIRALGYKP